MNNINEYLRNMATSYINKIHDIMDVIIAKFQESFNAEMQFDQNNNVFVGDLGEYKAILTRDYNGFFIKVNIVNAQNEILAECGLNAEGKYSETYARLPKEFKQAVAAWFDTISEIDVNTLGDESTDEPSEVAESEKVEAEIVAE